MITKLLSTLATATQIGFLALYVSFVTQGRASTFVSGSVSGTWTTSGSPYIATGNLVVNKNQTLTMQPGVTLIMGQGLDMSVEGTISAIGTASSRITIRGANSSMYWNQLYVKYTGAAPSVFIHCNFTDATNALVLSINQVTGDMDPTIRQCVFSNCVDAGIHAMSTALSGNYACEANLSGMIANCRFEDSKNGIHFYVKGSDGDFSPPCSGSINTIVANNNFYNLTGIGVLFEIGVTSWPLLLGPSNPQLVGCIFKDCNIGVQKIGTYNLFNEEVSYNCFSGNSTNFVGYPVGVYGTICCQNSRGTPCDIANNILANPLFLQPGSYTLAPNSPCIDAGHPQAVYFDTSFPPSQGTPVNDQGVYGGPYAGGWLTLNQAPTIEPVANTNVNEETTLTVALRATDPDATQTLNFSLGGIVPSGAEINFTTGVFTWTPNESQGPGTNTITVIVADSGTPSAKATNTFLVVVNEINVTPVLHVRAPQTVYATTTLTATNYATDSDIPGNSLTFSLISPPNGASINPTTGVLTWTPTGSQLGTNTILVKVTDFNARAINTQQLSTTNSLIVVVRGLTAPSFTLQPASQVVGAGQSVTFTAAATGYPTPSYQWQFSGANIPGATRSSYTIPSPGLSNIGYYTVRAGNSVTTNSSVSVSLTFLKLNTYAGLNILGPLGANYSIQSIPALGGTTWTVLTNISLPTQPYIYIDYSSATNALRFYQALPQ